jgi:hypothetical protein
VFLYPFLVLPKLTLAGLYSYKNNPNSRLRTITIRTFCGSCVTLTSSIVCVLHELDQVHALINLPRNLSVLMALQGEPAWVCLMCCNSDILFNTVVVHWVTSQDPQSQIGGGSLPSEGPRESQHGPSSQGGNIPINSTRGYQRKSGLVTNISALAKDSDVGDDIESSKEGEMGCDDRGGDRFQLNAIKVRTDHVREEWRKSTPKPAEDGGESSSLGSTKDLVNRQT